MFLLIFLLRDEYGEVTAKLGDFGLGVILFQGNVQPSYVGTSQYIPPVRPLLYLPLLVSFNAQSFQEVTRSSPL